MDVSANDALNLFRVDGKTALVTGASSGLGRRFAEVLHAAGANIVVTARRAERLTELVDTLPGALALPADIADPAAREQLVADAVQATGGIDILVNNAGISVATPIESETLDVFERVMNVNTTAVWHLSKLCGVGMVERGWGSVVNIASMLGFVASTPVKQTNYAASKGAVINLTRELAAQWARKGVRVNAICPGWFPSEMTEDMGDDKSQNWIRQNSPIPRMGYAHELDGALLLLASDAGSFITGQSLIVDGGWTIR